MKLLNYKFILLALLLSSCQKKDEAPLVEELHEEENIV
jgi:hypothetical protein